MASNPFESQWIFGLHDPGGEQVMLAANRPGWIVFTEAVGHDPRNRSGRDYRAFSGRGIGVICRINHGYHPDGTLPLSRYYGDFAQRCGNFVAASPGCRIWIIGNETNYEIERPALASRDGAPRAEPMHPVEPIDAGRHSGAWLNRVMGWLRRMVSSVPQARGSAAPEDGFTAPPDDPFLHGLPQRFNALFETGTLEAPTAQAQPRQSTAGEVITPAMYAQCYRLCRDAIHRLPGHEQDQVLVASPAPWNNQTRYPGNERGDWIRYLQDVLELLGPDYCDGFTLHTYTHGAALSGITSEARMNPPFADRRFQFRTYQDFLQATPISMRHLPVYISETDQNDPWTDANTGWVRAAYKEIDDWNQRPGTQKVRALALYRWPRFDRWYIEGKDGVIADFRAALAHDYRWDRSQPQPALFKKGSRLRVLSYVNLRRTPGYVNKPAGDLVAELQPNQEVVVTEDGSAQGDGLQWWRVEVYGTIPPVSGWIAQYGPDGVPLVETVAGGTPTQPPPTQPPTTQPPPTQPPTQPVTARFQRGARVRTTTIVNARKSAGYLNKPAEDVVQEVPAGMVIRLGEGPQIVDNLVWWLGAVDGGGAIGWMAENAPSGEALLEAAGASTPPTSPPAVRFKPGDRAMTVAFVRLRRTPGYMNKPPDDVIADIWQGTVAVIISGPKDVDELKWWEVETQEITGKGVRGWMAESAPGGVPLLGDWTAEDRTPFKVGDLGVVGAAPIRVRRTPGFLAKPDNDVLGEFAPRTTLYLQEGPRTVDNVAWWRVSGLAAGAKVNGWVAQGATNGATLVGRALKLQGTDIPNVPRGLYLGTPYSGQYVITQLWGENPGFYSRYSYEGVPLLGHNGIDFGTPHGVAVLAAEAGEVVQTGYEPTGFGHFILLAHPWGQSIYAHLNSVSVQMGQQVGRSQTIGISGNTGNSSGPHLHFAIRIHPFTRSDGWGGFSDPLPYLNPRDIAWPAYLMELGPQQVPQQSTVPGTEMVPPPGMADDAPGYIRP